MIMLIIITCIKYIFVQLLKYVIIRCITHSMGSCTKVIVQYVDFRKSISYLLIAA